MQRVKIVATLGPSSADGETIGRMIAAGLDVVRLNFSHGSHDDHRRLFELTRAEAKKADHTVAILADLCGPKIRVGRVLGGAVELAKGRPFVITTDEIVGHEGRVSTSYMNLSRDVRPGDRILLDDGLIQVVVQKIENSEVHCEVVCGGILRDRKGMNIPGTPLSTPALTDKDKQDIAFARELDVDYFALSFVRRAEDVTKAKQLAGDIPVIAKIEKPEAVSNIDEIIAVSDGLMVARGDLGVEAGAEKVPLIQKRLIRDAAINGLPVIVATQMLDSMIHNPRPTRAEVSDVANAVLDGTDAVMLSGETASGKYPVEAIEEMAAILEEIEGSEIFRSMPIPPRLEEQSFSNAIARAAVTAASDLNLKALAVYTETGRTASLVSAYRPLGAIVAFSRRDRILRRLALRWGVIPILMDWMSDLNNMVEGAERELLLHGIVQPGDEIGVTFGSQDLSTPSRTDMLKLFRIREITGGNRG
ncbi:MAG: pyruvate kinase [Proteobacteria bacterium]|nr:pyruvate kinase [Pseudomonadota bacterium]